MNEEDFEQKMRELDAHYLREATLRAVRNPGTVTLARDLKSLKS